MKFCIMIWRDSGYIIVPFETEEARFAWTSGADQQEDDTTAPWGGRRRDPRWQCIELADPAAPPVVLAPDEAARWAAEN